MPNIGVWHPQIVHFVIALLVMGVIFRIISLTGRFRFTNPAATTLIVVGTLAAVLAAKSGDDAHEPVEDIPGARDALVEHEHWGERTRNLFLAIAALEIVVLILGTQEKRQQVTKGAAIVSAGLGLVGLFFLYETGEHGGAVVYSYAGGVGTRSGDPADVERLLIAGLYQNAVRDRKAGRSEAAARLFEEMERRRPDDPAIRLLAIESVLLDRKDPSTALARLRGFAAGEDEGLRAQTTALRVDAFLAAGQRDSAQAAFSQLQKDFPTFYRIRDLTAKMQAGQ